MPHPRYSSSSPLLSPPLLIILLPIFTLIFLFFAVPSFLSVTSHLFRPTSVKKSWDSFNIFLVVFAILCGVFARKNDDESSPGDDEITTSAVTSNVTYEKTTQEGGYVSQQWFGFSERKIHDNSPIRLQSPAAGVNRLRRSSSSYPDLRQVESSWDAGNSRYQSRFFDDFEIEKFRSPVRDQFSMERYERPVEAAEEVHVKEIPVDTFEIRSSPPPKSLVPPPPPPPPPPPGHKPRRAYQSVQRREEENADQNTDGESTNIRSPPQTPPPFSPPPPPSVQIRPEHNRGKSERRKSNVKREIAMVWASVLSRQRKSKKKQRTKSSHNHVYDDVLFSSAELPNNTPPQPPPPPPPPPPPSVFHSWFKKSLSKSNKKVHSVSTPPPPPPPLPLTSSKRWSKRKTQVPPPPPPPAPLTPPRRRHTLNTRRPPLPTRTSNYHEATINSGNQSPLIPIPPPPPPPFKMPEMKFKVPGDYVRTWSNHSSRCSSPEREHVDVSSAKEEAETTNPVGDGLGSVFCPSPDVNVKAATFIARLRGEWKLEKLNSLKEKRTLGLD